MAKAAHFLVMISLFIVWSTLPAGGQTASEREIDEIKQDISRLYTIPSKKISVHLRNGTKMKGYINEVESESFILVNSENTVKTTIRYESVAKVNRSGMSNTQKYALIGAAAAGLVVVGLVTRSKAKGGLRCLFC